MSCSILLHTLPTCVSIAIHTKMTTSIIHTDVFAHHATAGLALPFVLQVLPFNRYIRNPTKQIRFGQLARMQVVHQLPVIAPNTLHQFTVYATVVLYAIFVKVYFFRASSQTDIPSFRSPDIPHLRQTIYDFHPLHCIHLCRFHIFFRKHPGFLHQIALHFAVGSYIHKAEHQFVRIPLQSVTNLPDTAKQRTRCHAGRQHQRVKPPNHPLTSYPLRQGTKCLYPFLHARHIRFKALLHIIIQRHLEIIVNTSLVQLMQIRKYRLRILRPKHNDLTMCKRHVHFLLSVERIVPDTIAFLQPGEEPVGVKGRDVRRTTGRDDDGSGGFYTLVSICPYLQFIAYHIYCQISYNFSMSLKISSFR